MLTETEMKILASFFPEGRERTTKEIEERSGYSHERVYSTLNNLHQKSILKKRKIGKTLLFSITKFNDPVFFAFLYGVFKRKENFIKKYPLIWNALVELINKTRIESVILFGSYSKGGARKDSDVDILCIGGNSKIEKVALSLRHKFNLRITPVIVKKRDFKNIKIENPEFWDDLVNFGLVLTGHELFFELVYCRFLFYSTESLKPFNSFSIA